MPVEGVDDIVVLVGDRCLEEETEVAKHGAHRLFVDFHAGEKLTQNNHVVHEGHGKERVLAHVVAADGADAAHEDLGRVLVESPLAVTNERNVFDNNFVVDMVSSFAGVLLILRLVRWGVKDGV